MSSYKLVSLTGCVFFSLLLEACPVFALDDHDLIKVSPLGNPEEVCFRARVSACAEDSSSPKCTEQKCSVLVYQALGSTDKDKVTDPFYFCVNGGELKMIPGDTLYQAENLRVYASDTVADQLHIEFRDKQFAFMVKENEGVYCNTEGQQVSCNKWENRGESAEKVCELGRAVACSLNKESEQCKVKGCVAFDFMADTKASERNGSPLSLSVNGKPVETVDGDVRATSINLAPYLPAPKYIGDVEVVFEGRRLHFKVKEGMGVYCDVEGHEIFCGTWK